jgi:hypothetical protein
MTLSKPEIRTLNRAGHLAESKNYGIEILHVALKGI